MGEWVGGWVGEWVSGEGGCGWGGKNPYSTNCSQRENNKTRSHINLREKEKKERNEEKRQRKRRRKRKTFPKRVGAAALITVPATSLTALKKKKM